MKSPPKLSISYGDYSLKQNNTVKYSGCYLDSNLNWESMARRLKTLTQIYISYGDKATIWVIRIEDCYIMFLYNHTLTMDAHHGILSWLRPWKLNWKLIKTCAYPFSCSSHLVVI